MSTGEQKVSVNQALKDGYQAFARRELDKATAIAKAILHASNKVPQAHFLIGLIASSKNQLDVAFQAFQSVVALDKNHAGAWAHLANYFMKYGMVNRAESALNKLREIRSDDPMVLDLMGETLILMGEATLAKACYARAHTINPENILIMYNLANTLIFCGETDESEQVVNAILKKQPDFPQAHWLIAGAKKAKDTSHIEQMETFVNQVGPNPIAKSFYHYGIGKEYEDLEMWDKAFTAFAEGAKAKRATMPYDEQEEIEAFEYLKETFTEQWLTDGKQGHDDESPIFVLGQPRTGTTLIERIITAHSDVHSAGELQQMRLSIVRVGNVTSPKLLTKDTFAAAKEIDPEKVGQIYLQSSGRMRGDKPRFVDKLPQNYLLIPIILKALPKAKIVHLVRNPMDACFASFKQLFAEAYAHSYDLEDMARHHIRYLDLMAIWRERFGDRFFDISYEETARNLEPNARALIDFLELPWQDECLNFHQQKGAVTTASTVQVRQPVHTKSIGRWRRYESQLQPMRQIIEAAGLQITE